MKSTFIKLQNESLQKDIGQELRDKKVFMSGVVITVISFVYKDKWWFDGSMSFIFCMENT